LKQGPIVVANIGSPDAAILSETGLTWAGTSKIIADKPRNPDGNKGRFGHILIIGGADGKAGAPAMASLAALRAGPGLGQDPDAQDFVLGLIDQTDLPIVIDADALNAIAERKFNLNGKNRTIVLTPHPGEMARLVGMSIPEVEADREGIARKYATEHRVTLVLKGWRTIVAHPDGRLAINTTGNPGLAKGGSGDILTGIVAALLGQYKDDPAAAVEAAVYLHGLAADFATAAQDQHTLLATDVIDHLWKAFQFHAADRVAGYTWLQGLPGTLQQGADH
jgi:NAD(P)H-hydrate epimerase